MKTHTIPRRWLTAAFSAALALLLAACGGGGGIGSGGTGAAAMGTVDGFGSIFIGGERCDDIGARIEYDTVAGGPEPAQAEVKLGMRVEADLDGASSACKILVARIAPEVVGVVSATSPLTVAGAQVLVNTDPLLGPVTVFDGYDSAADIALGDRVEVHGKAVAVSGGVAIRATRIERKPTTDTWVRVAGVISNLNATTQTFTLGGLTVSYSVATTIVPANVADHVAAVAVFGNPSIRLLGNPLTALSPLYGPKTIDLCNGADPVCSNGDDVAAHSLYVQSGMATQAAQFVAGRIAAQAPINTMAGQAPQ